MKVKNLLMAVLLTALYVNFTSCSDDEEGGGSNSEGATKRLVGMEVICDDEKTELSLEYDSQGRVSEMVLLFDEPDWQDKQTVLYTYNGNEVTVSQTWTGDSHPNGTGYEDVYQLNDKGYVVNGTCRFWNIHEDFTSSFQYTDDYLISIEIKPYSFEGLAATHQLLTDGKILPDAWSSIEYTDIPNKGGLFYMYTQYPNLFDEFEWYELYFANLAGKAHKYLPQKAGGDTTYDYELDDGYVKAFTITRDDVVASCRCTYENI